MMDIWIRSIARAGGVEVPPDRRIVEPERRATPVAVEKAPPPVRPSLLQRLVERLGVRHAPARECDAY